MVDCKIYLACNHNLSHILITGLPFPCLVSFHKTLFIWEWVDWGDGGRTEWCLFWLICWEFPVSCVPVNYKYSTLYGRRDYKVGLLGTGFKPLWFLVLHHCVVQWRERKPCGQRQGTPKPKLCYDLVNKGDDYWLHVWVCLSGMRNTYF